MIEHLEKSIHPATRWIACAVISAVAAMMSAGTGHAGAMVVPEYVVNVPAGATSFRPSRDISGWTPGTTGDAVRSRPGDSRSYWSPLFGPEPGPYAPALSAKAPILQFQQSPGTPEVKASPELAALFQTRRGGDRAAQLERWEINPDFRTTRIRDAVRLLLNVGRESGGRSRPATVSAPDRSKRGGGNSDSIQAAILDLPLDQEMLDLIFSVLSPSLEPSGLISFSIAGLGNFLMVLSDEIGALRIIDLDGGNTLVLKSSPQDLSAPSRRNPAESSGLQRQGTASKITFQQFVVIVRQFILSILQDLRFIIILFIFLLLWLVLILYRRRV